MATRPLPPKPLVAPLFRKVFGDDFADFIEEVVSKVTKSKIDSVGRERAAGVSQSLERAQRQPERPPEDFEDQWWNK